MSQKIVMELKNGRELFRSAISGNQDSYFELIRHGVLLSLEIAKEKAENVDVAELFEAGFQGWKLAYKNYDDKGKHDWVPYSKWWIRNAINAQVTKK